MTPGGAADQQAMDAQARAGIEFSESALRYAEVEQYGHRYRLLRLGTCDFDFDIVSDVLQGGDASSLDVVAEALQDVFSGSLATVINVAIHPQLTHSFVTSMPRSVAREDRERRIAQETALLTDVSSHADVEIDLYPAPEANGATDVYVNVLATPARLHQSIREVLATMAGAEQHIKLTTHGSAAVMELLNRDQESPEQGRGGCRLAIGAYHGFGEYCIATSDGLRYSSHASAAGSADLAYFGASYMRELGIPPEAVQRVYVYGDAIPADAYELLNSVWSGRVSRLDPLEVVDLDPDTLTGEFASEIYAPCVGAAL